MDVVTTLDNVGLDMFVIRLSCFISLKLAPQTVWSLQTAWAIYKKKNNNSILETNIYGFS